MIVPFFQYSAIDNSLFAGAINQFDFLSRIETDGSVTNLLSTAPAIADKGGGLYDFAFPDSGLIPGTIINYSISAPNAAGPIADHINCDNAIAQLAGTTGFIDRTIDQRSEVLQGDAVDSLVYWARKDGEAQTIDAGTGYVTLLDNAASIKVARALCTVAANGKLSVSQAWPLSTWPLQEDAFALFEWQVAGVPFSDRLYFDVVKNKLPCPIDTSDLLRLYPDLELHLQAIGETSTKKFIQYAWSKILNRLRTGHTRPSLILEKNRLAEPTIELALYLCCRALSRNKDDLWWSRKEDHGADYGKSFAGLGELKYDRDEDAIADPRDFARGNRRKFRV